MIITSTGKWVDLRDLLHKAMIIPELNSVLSKIYVFDLADVRNGLKRFRRLSRIRRMDHGFEIQYDLMANEEHSKPVSSFSYYSGNLPTFRIRCIGLDTKMGVLRVYTS